MEFKRLIEYYNNFQKTSGIYQIKNKINNKIYIGSAINIRIRIKNHYHDFKNKKHSNKYLQNTYNKYGKDVFEISVLEEIIDKTKLIEREQYWLDKTQCYKKNIGYNIARIAYSGLGTKRTNQVKNKMSNACGHKKKIYQYNLNGYFLQEYLSITDAAKKLNLTMRNISSCCNKKRKSYAGFMWSFELNYNLIYKKDINYKRPKAKPNDKRYLKRKIVLQYDLKTNFIKE